MTFGVDRADISKFHDKIKKDNGDPGIDYNLRGKLWRVICCMNDRKQQMLFDYENQRQEELKAYNKLSKSKKKKVEAPTK